MAHRGIPDTAEMSLHIMAQAGGSVCSRSRVRDLELSGSALGQPGGSSLRPATAKGNSAKGGTSSAWRQLQRPTSAPALLRGDSLIAQRPYEDDFLQGIEDNEVRRILRSMRQDKYLVKDFVGGVDVLNDQTLFDLKVLHNSNQRAKSAAEKARVGTSPCRGGSRSLRRGSQRRRSKGFSGGGGGEDTRHRVKSSPTEQVKDLAQVMRHDIRHHCARIGMSHNSLDKHLSSGVYSHLGRIQVRVLAEQHNIGGMHLAVRRQDIDPPTFADEFKSLFNKRVEVKTEQGEAGGEGPAWSDDDN